MSVTTKNLTLMVVFAHPDDEAFGVGGTLAKYAAEGCQVYLVTATRGEAGQIAEPDLATPANLPLVREQELRCACETYGIHPPRFLNYQDGQLTVVHQGQGVGKLVRIIRELRPDVLLTYDSHGIYGHYDHIAVHRWTTIAYDLAADPDCFPGQLDGVCQPHQPDKLYYYVLSEERVADMSQGGRPAAVMMDGVPFAFAGWRKEEITTVIDVRNYAAVKVRGIQCHATQVGRHSRFEAALDEMADDPFLTEESFILARSTALAGPSAEGSAKAERPPGVETDLFAGLRESQT